MVDPCMLFGAATYGACTALSCVKGKKKDLAGCKSAILSKKKMKKSNKASSIIPLSDEHTKVLYFVRDSYRPRNVVNVYDENKAKIYSFEKTQCTETGSQVCIPPLSLVNKKRESMVPWDLVNVNQRRIVARLGIKRAKSWIEFMPHYNMSKSKGCYSSNMTIVKSQKSMLLGVCCSSKYQTFLKARDGEGNVCGRYEWTKLAMNLDWITPTNNPAVECRRRVAIARKLSAKNFKCITKVLECTKDKIPSCVDNADNANNIIDYEITYDSTLIPRELLITTTFISIMTQWKHLKQTKTLLTQVGCPKVGKIKRIKRKVLMKTKHVLHMVMATSEMKTNMALIKSRKMKGISMKLLGKTVPPTLTNPKGDPLINACKNVKPYEPLCDDSGFSVKKKKQIIGPCGDLLCAHGIDKPEVKCDYDYKDTKCPTISKICAVSESCPTNKGSSNNNNGGITIINNPLPPQNTSGMCTNSGQYPNNMIPDDRNYSKAYSFGTHQSSSYFDNISPFLITEEEEEEIIQSPFYIDDSLDISTLYSEDKLWDQELGISGASRSNQDVYIDPSYDTDPFEYYDTPIQYHNTGFSPYEQEYVDYYPSEEYHYSNIDDIEFQKLPFSSTNKRSASHRSSANRCATRTPTPVPSPSYIYKDGHHSLSPSALIYEPLSKTNYYQPAETFSVGDEYTSNKCLFSSFKSKKKRKKNKTRDYETIKNTKFNKKLGYVGSDLLKKGCLSAPCLVESVCSSPGLIKNKVMPLSSLCSRSDGKPSSSFFNRKKRKLLGSMSGSADFPTSRGRDVNRGYYS